MIKLTTEYCNKKARINALANQGLAAQLIAAKAEIEQLRKLSAIPFEYSLRRPMETERDFVNRNLNMFRKAIRAAIDKARKEQKP